MNPLAEDAGWRAIVRSAEMAPTATIVRAMARYAESYDNEARAEAWDEGYQLDWTGGVRWHNPYRPTPTDCTCLTCRRAASAV